MDIDKNQVEDVAQAEEMTANDHADTEPQRKSGRRIVPRICAFVGLLCGVAAWLMFYSYPEQAVMAGVCGLCASVAGLWSGRGCLRSLSVTGIVVSAVLLLVNAAFYWGLAWGVNHL